MNAPSTFPLPDMTESKRLDFMRWRLCHDHALKSADLAAAFDIAEVDALAMLRGDQPVPEWAVTASKAALSAWHRAGHVGDIRQHLRREATALSLEAPEIS